MYKSNRELKQEARQALSGKWLTAVGMTLLTGLITYSLSYTNPENPNIMVTFTSLIASVLNVILSVGLLSFFMKICCGQKQDAGFKDLFYGFQCHPGKAILLYLLNTLYLLPGTLIYLVLTFVFLFVTFASSGASLNSMLYDNIYIDTTMLVGFLVIFIALTILYIVYAIYIEATYGLVYYLLLDYPDLSTTQIWKRSAQMMKGHRLRKIGLELSFIPWTIVSIFTLFIGLFWLVPYMNASYTEFYLDLVKHQTAPKQEGTVPNQQFYYETSTSPSDTNMTHDCEQAHPETQEQTEGDYRGIDPNTFK